MMYLKTTSIKTSFFMKTLIVLTIIGRVFSESEVEKCARYINGLYRYLGINSRLDMFKQGFLMLNAKEINEINGTLAPKSDPGSEIITAMNKYTYGYFLKFLNHVEITGKNSLPSPHTFCKDTFPTDGITVTISDPDQLAHFLASNENKIIVCTKIITEKFNIRAYLEGQVVFDIFYENMTTKDLAKILLLEEEKNDLFGRILVGSFISRERAIDMVFHVDKHLEELIEFLQNYYKRFEDILLDADVGDMPTPEDFCRTEINQQASSSTSLVEELENLDV